MTVARSSPCKYKDETGLICPHMKAVLLWLGVVGLGKQWVDKRFHTSTYQYAESYGADIPGIMCIASQLQPNENYCPPDYKRSAGCLPVPKKRKDQSYYKSTDVKRKCKSCGKQGHFAVSCTNPSTKFCYNKRKAKALLLCKNHASTVIEED